MSERSSNKKTKSKKSMRKAIPLIPRKMPHSCGMMVLLGSVRLGLTRQNTLVVRPVLANQRTKKAAKVTARKAMRNSTGMTSRSLMTLFSSW